MRRRTAPASSGLQNPLSGILRCGKCGRLMTRLAPGTRNPYSTLKCPGRSCDNISSPLFLIENQVLAFLQEWLGSYSLERSFSPDTPLTGELQEKELTLKKVNTDITAHWNQREKACSLLEQGVYTVELFQQRLKTLEHRISLLETNRKELLSDIEQLRRLQKEQDNYLPRIRHLLETYHTNTPAVNNDILKELIDRILYEKSQPNRRGQLNRCNFSLDIYPRLPK